MGLGGVIDRIGDTINGGANSLLDATWDVTVFTEENHQLLAALVDRQLSVISHPNRDNLLAWGKTYGVIIATGWVPGAGWYITGAVLAIELAQGIRRVDDLVFDLVKQQWPEAAPLVDALRARGKGLRSMLIAAAVANLPPDVRPLAALALRVSDDPQGVLVNAAIELLPAEPRELRSLAAAAVRGDLKDEALNIALSRLPPEAALVIAIAKNPRGAITDIALANVPSSMRGLVEAARSGDFGRDFIAGVLQATGNNELLTMAIAADAAVQSGEAQWKTWKDESRRMVKDLQAVRVLYEKRQEGQERLRKVLVAGGKDLLSNPSYAVGYGELLKIKAQVNDLARAVLTRAKAGIDQLDALRQSRATATTGGPAPLPVTVPAEVETTAPATTDTSAHPWWHYAIAGIATFLALFALAAPRSDTHAG